MQTRIVAIVFAIFCTGLTSAQEKEKSVQVDPSGTWRWEYELGGQTMKDSLEVNLGSDKKVVAYYKGRGDDKILVQDPKLDGDALSFHFSIDFQGTPVRLDFQGKIKQDDIDGAVIAKTNDGSQEFPWAPKRSVLADDVLGRWKLRIDAGERILEPTLEITKDGDKLKGTYTNDQKVTTDLIDLKVEKNQLLFRIKTQANDTKVQADFKGRPYGDAIKGSLDYDLSGNTGTIDFSGARLPNAKK